MTDQLQRLELWLDQFHLGDCLDVMAKIPPASIDLIVTSPPYNLRQTSGGGFNDIKNSTWPTAKLRTGYEDYDDKLDEQEYVQWQRKCLTAMMRLLTPDGAIFYNHKWRMQRKLIQDRHDIVTGFPVRQIIIWDRGSSMPNGSALGFYQTYEVVYMIAQTEFRLNGHHAAAWGSVWRFPPAFGNPHPAPFPIELPNRIIKSTNAKVILDPFIGSGTTAVAAIQNERHFIGIDRASEYLTWAAKRIQTAHHQRELFP